MISPPRWSAAQLEADRDRAEQAFRNKRFSEPVEIYERRIDEYRSAVAEMFRSTRDLRNLQSSDRAILTDDTSRTVYRYLFGPPISDDDLKVIANARSFSESFLARNGETVERLLQFAAQWHDRRRFPWLSSDRAPTSAERDAAILATSVLLAVRRLETERRSADSATQEMRVAEALDGIGFRQTPRRPIRNIVDAPEPGAYCRELLFGPHKADFVVTLRDRRIMPMECKVSNSSTNSIKRLNKEAAGKAETWLSEFGHRHVVPAAVLDGVFKVSNLVDVQDRGLTLFWSHDLAAMSNWISSAHT